MLKPFSKLLTLSALTIAMSQISVAETPTGGNSFQCTDEEVEQYIIESAERREHLKETVPSFEEFKTAHQEQRAARLKKEGNEEQIECNTIFDDMSAPKIPDDFFNFDPSGVTDIGNRLVEALGDALESGFCRAISADYVEGNVKSNIYDYDGAIREQGIRRQSEPWLPQIMQKQLRNTYGRQLGDALNFSSDNQVDSFRRLSGDQWDEFLTEGVGF